MLNNFIECAPDDVDDPDRDQRLQLDRDQSESGNFILTKKNKTLLVQNRSKVGSQSNKSNLIVNSLVVS